MRKQKGLTLIELLAVIAIIAILFVLLIPQITKAADKARVSGVQVDLHSFEVGMRSYFMEHFGEVKTVEKLNTYLDKSLQLEEVDGKFVSKTEMNPYDIKYELTSDWQTYMQVNSYTDEKDPRIHAVRVYEEGNEVKSIYIGFDEDKLKSEVDTEKPVITIRPNGGEDIDNVFVDVTDNVALFSVQYAWTKDSTFPQKGWHSIESNTELHTAFLGKGTYYLHIKASDLEMNVAKETSLAFVLGDSELPVITLTMNGSEEEKIKHTTIVNVTDNKGVDNIKYVWTDSEAKPTTGWKEIANGSTITTPDQIGGLYLHVEAVDISGNPNHFVSKPFNTGDTEKPVITLSPNGNTTVKDAHTVVVNATDNNGIKKLEYSWSKSETETTEPWVTITSGATLTTPEKINADAFLHVKAVDLYGNKEMLVSKVFKINFDNTPPTISITTNGSTVTSVTHTTKVTVTDNRKVDKIMYVWTDTEAVPIEGWKTITSGTDVTSPALEGHVFLHVIAYDVVGNEAKFTSKFFNQSPYTTAVNEDGTLTISNYQGVETDIVIPRTIGGKDVTVIGRSTFLYETVTSVVIHEGIRSILQDAFRSTGLKTVTIPGSVKDIGTYAFLDNHMTEVIFEEGLEIIGPYSFKNNDLTTVKIPNSVKTIDNNAFFENELTSVDLGNGVESLGVDAFRANQLTTITLPASLKSLGGRTFWANPNLTHVINKSTLTNAQINTNFLNMTPTITNE